MKDRILITIGMIFLFGAFTITNVDGSVPFKPQSFQDLNYKSDLVIKGTIISLEDDATGEHQVYHIGIIKQFSNPPRAFDLITAFMPVGQSSFDVNDTVLLYLDKLDTKYMISPYSFKIHPNCDSLSFADLSSMQGQTRLRSAPGTFPEIIDTQGNKPDFLEVGTPYSIRADKFWHEPTDQLDLEVTIQNLDNGKTILKERKIHHGEPCDWKNNQWSVAFDQPGRHFAMITKYEQLFDRYIIRPTVIQTAKFTVGADNLSISATSSGTNLSLMHQLQSGIPAEHIVCLNGNILAFKYDGSPACVTESTKTKLVERGWAKQSLPPCTSDRTACFNQESNMCDPAGWECGDNGEIFSETISLLPEPKKPSTAFPYIWNDYLHKQGIEFEPKEQSYFNTGEGWYSELNRVCSPIVTSNGTEIYVSSTFVHEPFEIIGTFIDNTKPDDCHKIWKTESVLPEPDKELEAWLEIYHNKN